MSSKKLEDFKEYLIKRPKEEINKEFQDFKETVIGINLNKLTTTKKLNVDKIKDLNDVKRILNFLNIEVEANGVTEPNGYDEVRDLFEN